MAVNPEQVADCLFYGDSASGTWSELVTDDSEESTNLTAGTSSGYETNSTRANLTTTRTVDAHLNADSGEQGVVWKWDRGGGDYSSLEWDTPASLEITVTHNGGTDTHTLSMTAPGISAEEFIVSWSMEPNPDTTGASDAMRSELWVYNVDDDEHGFLSYTHPAESGTATGTMIFGAADTSDTDAFSGTFEEIRLSSGFHTTVETFETFDTQSSAPTLKANEYRPLALPDRSQVAIGDDGAFAGPVLIMAAKAAEQHRMLNCGPIVNDINNDGDFLSTGLVSSKTVIHTLDDPATSLRMEHLYWRPIPIGVTHVVPYIHVQSDEGTSSADLEVYLFSMNQPGPLSQPESSSGAFEKYYRSSTVSTDHGAGDNVGEWVTMDPVRIAFDDLGWSYFCVGLTIDTGNSSTARVNSVVLDPVVVEAGDGLGSGGITLG